MNIAIESLSLQELKAYLHEQADDAFPDLKDEKRLNELAEKWYSYAKFATCRLEEGKLVGMIAFYANKPETGVLYIPHIYVSCKYRGLNIMGEMLHAIEKQNRDEGFNCMQLEVQKINERAIFAYTHFGFFILCEASSTSFFMQYKIC
jgi:D-cysteine desulfhydrase